MREIQRNIADALRRTMEARQQTIIELSEELDISRTALLQYLRGESNPRADTLAAMADKLGITPAELITGIPPGAASAEQVLRAAKEIGSLPPERRQEGIALFLALVDVFSCE